MAKPSGITVRVETWEVSNTGKNKNPKVNGDRKIVTKIAVRHSNGQFHGATNYPQKY